jgi:hypothetical protein
VNLCIQGIQGLGCEGSASEGLRSEDPGRTAAWCSIAFSARKNKSSVTAAQKCLTVASRRCLNCGGQSLKKRLYLKRMISESDKKVKFFRLSVVGQFEKLAHGQYQRLAIR